MNTIVHRPKKFPVSLTFNPLVKFPVQRTHRLTQPCAPRLLGFKESQGEILHLFTIISIPILQKGCLKVFHVYDQSIYRVRNFQLEGYLRSFCISSLRSLATSVRLAVESSLNIKFCNMFNSSKLAFSNKLAIAVSDLD